MGCKTVGKFYIDTSTAVAVNAAAVIPFVHGRTSNGCLSFNAGVITIKAPGLYLVGFNSTPIATAIGDVEAILQVNGQNILGASSSDSLAVIGDAGSLNFITTITLNCNDALSVLNISGTSYNVANLIIMKVA